ncbi:MAG TPA: MraY family glycosyltransferase [Pedobacter sp.]|jgi:UDP-N-acetylmuramyl pentapeptide phosphotransferase/UDP-N-acetylglucosamine-1-phosphate transferase
MLIFFAIASSFLLTALIVPVVIRVAIRRRLFDAPTETRKVHKRIIPNLGGIAIFAGFMFSQQLFIRSEMIPALNQLLMCGSILFMLGLKDDIIGLSPYKKFVAQFVAALIVAMIGNIRIMDLGGVLGMYELSYPFSISLTVFAIVGVVNAFNLIDGIDGLAGLLGLIVSLTYACLFLSAGDTGWSFLCFSLAGALGGFLIYNITPAKIFMGDSGALMIGFFSAVTSIHFINLSSQKLIHIGQFDITSAIGLVMALLIIPLFDTLRVFTLRILGNRSPFEADRNHLHHRLLSVGLSHFQATLILTSLTLVFVGLAYLFQDIGSNELIATLAIIILSLNTGFTLYTKTLEDRRTEKLINNMQPSFVDQDKLKIVKHLEIEEKKVLRPVFEKISQN